jgi:hypothetical protein
MYFNISSKIVILKNQKDRIMITIEKTSTFYKNPSVYLSKKEVIKINDSKTNTIKCFIIPEGAVKDYEHIFTNADVKQQILNSFKHYQPKEFEEAFIEDIGIKND